MWRFRVAREIGCTQSQLDAMPLSEFLTWCAYLRIADRAAAGKG